MPHNLQAYLDFTIETVFLAGKLTLGYFQRDITPDYKKDSSPVTIADRLAEELIRSRIEKNYPRTRSSVKNKALKKAKVPLIAGLLIQSMARSLLCAAYRSMASL